MHTHKHTRQIMIILWANSRFNDNCTKHRFYLSNPCWSLTFIRYNSYWICDLDWTVFCCFCFLYLHTYTVCILHWWSTCAMISTLKSASINKSSFFLFYLLHITFSCYDCTHTLLIPIVPSERLHLTQNHNLT